MLKKEITTTNVFRNAKALTALAIAAFDNPGGPDGGKTGDEFSEDLLPEELKDSFAKYKQTLIDKGVNIGTAREREKSEKTRGQEVETFLKEQGISKDDIETLKPYLANRKSFEKLYEVYGTNDINEIISAIEEAERAEMSDQEKLAADLQSSLTENNDLRAQISSLQKALSDKESTQTEKEKKLLSFIERSVVNSAIKSAAIEAGAYDPDDVLSRIKDQVRLTVEDDDYIPVVVDEKGTKRFDSNGDPVTIAALVSSFLEARPHLKKSTLSGGAGSKGGNGKEATTSKFTAEQLKDSAFFQKHYNEIMAEIKSGKLKL